LVRAVVSIALERGATRAAAVAERLLAGQAVDASRLAPAVLEGLVGGGFATHEHETAHPSASLLAARATWSSLLDGQREELPAELSMSLDEWAAELLGALLAAPDDKPQLRRQLRKRGVAAFGLLAAATA
jgi:hypothetical protein